VNLLTFVLSAKGIEAQGDPATLWERFLQILPLLFVGPVPCALALIAIVVGALMLYLDSCRHDHKRSLNIIPGRLAGDAYLRWKDMQDTMEADWQTYQQDIRDWEEAQAYYRQFEPAVRMQPMRTPDRRPPRLADLPRCRRGPLRPQARG